MRTAPSQNPTSGMACAACERLRREQKTDQQIREGKVTGGDRAYLVACLPETLALVQELLAFLVHVLNAEAIFINSRRIHRSLSVR